MDAILSVAGNVDPDEILAAAEAAFGDWAVGQSPAVISGERGSRIEHLCHEGAQTQVGVAYRSVPFEHPEYYSAWGVVSVLGGGASARLFTEVRDRRGLCYAVSANHSSLRHEAQVLCYVGATNEQAQEALDVMMDVLLSLKDGIGDEELRRCKAGAKSALIMQQESSMSRARTLGSDWYHLGRLTSLDEIRTAIERLTPGTLMSHLESHPIGDFTIVTLGPQPLEVRRAIP
jgi:predicted Zn-dependent peptidase